MFVGLMEVLVQVQKKPVNCHLWRADVLRPQDLREALATVEQYVNESHFGQCLLKCNECSQLYFFAFYEKVDWDDGDDAQYWTYVPVDTIGEVEQFRSLGPLGLLAVVPRLQKDFPKGATEPKVYWVGK